MLAMWDRTNFQQVRLLTWRKKAISCCRSVAALDLSLLTLPCIQHWCQVGLQWFLLRCPVFSFSSCLLLWDSVGGWRGCGQILKSQSEVTSSVAYGSWCLQPLPSPRLASPLHRWKMVGGCWGADLMPLRLECWLDSLTECLFHACD
jgi:hypothetical protein